MASTMDHAVLDHASRGDGGEKLMLKLDELFEQYLNLLDQYQKARQQLSAHLSSGYMSLAQANFASTSRARYGLDYYDERMQASRKITVVEKGTGEEEFVVTCNLKPGERVEPEEESKSDPGEQDPEDANEDEKPTKNEEDANEKPKIDPRDPIRWFGVLVPPPLRSAQSKFIGIVQGPIPQLVTLTKKLRAMEIEIGRTRKSIKKLEK